MATSFTQAPTQKLSQDDDDTQSQVLQINSIQFSEGIVSTADPRLVKTTNRYRVNSTVAGMYSEEKARSSSVSSSQSQHSASLDLLHESGGVAKVGKHLPLTLHNNKNINISSNGSSPMTQDEELSLKISSNEFRMAQQQSTSTKNNNKKKIITTTTTTAATSSQVEAAQTLGALKSNVASLRSSATEEGGEDDEDEEQQPNYITQTIDVNNNNVHMVTEHLSMGMNITQESTVDGEEDDEEAAKDRAALTQTQLLSTQLEEDEEETSPSQKQQQQHGGLESSFSSQQPASKSNNKSASRTMTLLAHSKGYSRIAEIRESTTTAASATKSTSKVKKSITASQLEEFTFREEDDDDSASKKKKQQPAAKKVVAKKNDDDEVESDSDVGPPRIPRNLKMRKLNFTKESPRHPSSSANTSTPSSSATKKTQRQQQDKKKLDEETSLQIYNKCINRLRELGWTFCRSKIESFAYLKPGVEKKTLGVRGETLFETVRELAEYLVKQEPEIVEECFPEYFESETSSNESGDAVRAPLSNEHFTRRHATNVPSKTTTTTDDSNKTKTKKTTKKSSSIETDSGSKSTTATLKKKMTAISTKPLPSDDDDEEMEVDESIITPLKVYNYCWSELKLLGWKYRAASGLVDYVYIDLDGQKYSNLAQLQQGIKSKHPELYQHAVAFIQQEAREAAAAEEEEDESSSEKEVAPPKPAPKLKKSSTNKSSSSSSTAAESSAKKQVPQPPKIEKKRLEELVKFGVLQSFLVKSKKWTWKYGGKSLSGWKCFLPGRHLLERPKRHVDYLVSQLEVYDFCTKNPQHLEGLFDEHDRDLSTVGLLPSGYEPPVYADSDVSPPMKRRLTAGSADEDKKSSSAAAGAAAGTDDDEEKDDDPSKSSSKKKKRIVTDDSQQSNSQQEEQQQLMKSKMVTTPRTTNTSRNAAKTPSASSSADASSATKSNNSAPLSRISSTKSSSQSTPSRLFKSATVEGLSSGQKRVNENTRDDSNLPPASPSKSSESTKKPNKATSTTTPKANVDSIVGAAKKQRFVPEVAAKQSESLAEILTAKEPSSVFKNVVFFLTGFDSVRANKPGDKNDRYYQISFQGLMELIEKKGNGKVHTEVNFDLLNQLEATSATTGKTTILVAKAGSYRTEKYVMALVCGVPIVHQRFVIDCVLEGKLLDYHDYLLPKSFMINPDDNRIVPSHCAMKFELAASSRWDSEDKPRLDLTGKAFKVIGLEFWSHVIRELGGKVVSDMNLPSDCIILCGMEDNSETLTQILQDLQVRFWVIYTFDYLLQCILHGRMLDRNTNPKFRRRDPVMQKRFARVPGQPNSREFAPLGKPFDDGTMPAFSLGPKRFEMGDFVILRQPDVDLPHLAELDFADETMIRFGRIRKLYQIPMNNVYRLVVDSLKLIKGSSCRLKVMMETIDVPVDSVFSKITCVHVEDKDGGPAESDALANKWKKICGPQVDWRERVYFSSM